MVKAKPTVVTTTEAPEGASSSATTGLLNHLQKTSSAHVSRMTDGGSIITTPKFLSTGLPTIDHMMGGGIPAGRITELFSKGEGKGKSSLAAMLMAEMQRRGGVVLLMDTEHGFTSERLKVFGVDPEEIVYVEPAHIEGACQIISDTIKFLKQNNEKQDKFLIIWDSVTGTPCKSEAEADYGDVSFAGAPRALSASIKKLKDEIAKSECYVVMITQTRVNINAGPFAEKQSSTGGMALKYYAGQRLVLSHDANPWLKEGPQKVGMKVTMMTEKSRVAAPYQKADAHLYFDKGFDRWRSLFDLLLKLEIVEQKGGYYSILGSTTNFRAGDFDSVIQGLEEEAKDTIRDKLVAARINSDTISYFLG